MLSVSVSLTVGKTYKIQGLEGGLLIPIFHSFLTKTPHPTFFSYHYPAFRAQFLWIPLPGRSQISILTPFLVNPRSQHPENKLVGNGNKKSYQTRQTSLDGKQNSHSPFTREMFIPTSISISPSLILSIMSWGNCPSTVHPTDWQVPRISFTVPDRWRDMDLGRIVFAISITCSREMLPECLTEESSTNRIIHKVNPEAILHVIMIF